MGYTAYVGRVGALAVALGIGAAVGGAPLALADDAASKPSASSGSGATEGGGPSTSKSSDDSSGSTADSDAAQSDSDDESDDAGTDDAGTDDAGTDDNEADDTEPDDEQVPETDPAGDHGSADGPDRDEPEAGGADQAAGSGVVERDVEPTDFDRAASASADSAPAAPEGDDAGRDAVGLAVTDDRVQVDTVVPASQVQNVAAAAVVTGIETAAAPAQALPDTLVAFATAVVRAIITPFATPLPTGPDSPPLWLMLEWLRRTTVGTIYNRAPGANPLQIGEDADGVVVGAVGGTDPDGDPLTYVVTQGPKYGTVVIAANGVYTYTPGTALARDGGTDGFTVEVRDVGVRLLSQTEVTSVPIAVTVGAGDALGINGSPFGVAISSDGRRAYVTDVENNRVSVVDIAQGSIVDSVTVGRKPYGIAVHGDRAYVVNSGDGTVTIIDTTSNTVIPEGYLVGSSPTGIAVNVSGTRVVVANSDDNTVSVIDTTGGGVTRVEVGDGAFGVAISGNLALVTNEFDGTVSVVDLSSLAVVKTLQVGQSPTGIAVGGDRAVVTNTGSNAVEDDGTISIIDLDALTVIGAPIPIGDRPSAVAIDAEGHFAYVTDLGLDRVSVVDLTSGLHVGQPTVTVDGATGIAIAPDGSLYVAGYLGGTIGRIALDTWDLTTPAPTQPEPGAPAPLAATARMSAAAASSTPSWLLNTFTVYNLTTDTLRLTGFIGSTRPEGGAPTEGYTIAPGGLLRFQMPLAAFGATLQPTFKNSAGETWTTTFEQSNVFTGTGLNRVAVVHSLGKGTSDPEPGWYNIKRGSEVRILERPLNTVVLEADDPRRETLVRDLCNGGSAVCRFQSKGTPEEDWTPYTLAVTTGAPAIDTNYSDSPHRSVVEITIAKSTKVSFEGSLKLGLSLEKAFTTELSQKTGSEESNTINTKASVERTTPPWTRTSLYVRTPILRMTGDLIISIGNTRVLVSDIKYEVPDAKRGYETFTDQEDLRPPDQGL